VEDGNVDAEKMSTEAMRLRKRVLGLEHEDTLSNMTIVGCADNFRRRWDAAEEPEVQVMETRKKKPGADHPSTLASMANLASTSSKRKPWPANVSKRISV
jgi:hypothetical protein